ERARRLARRGEVRLCLLPELPAGAGAYRLLVPGGRGRLRASSLRRAVQHIGGRTGCAGHPIGGRLTTVAGGLSRSGSRRSRVQATAAGATRRTRRPVLRLLVRRLRGRALPRSRPPQPGRRNALPGAEPGADVRTT